MKRFLKTSAIVASLGLIVLLTVFGPSRKMNLWLTRDQQGDRLFRHNNYAEAAKRYADVGRQGVAQFRAGDFKAAAATLARDGSADGAFNRGNALVMLGKYDDAVKSYDRALMLHAGWKEAEHNRAIAALRRDRMQLKGGDVSGGKEKPDEVVFEKGKHSKGEEVQVAGGEPLDDAQLQALWLRRVRTKPADFLRAKFAFQQREKEGGAK